MPSLSTDLRKLLENAIPDVRLAAENAARAALTTLAVDRPEPFASLSVEQRRLRNALRAKARQLGAGSQVDGLAPLVEEIAYQQWHRLVFAAFLAENGLLMHPSGVAVTLGDCAELAAEEDEPDAWAAAARYTSGMLPGIFPPDEPSVQVRFAPEGRQELERLLESLPAAVFQSDDALGWMYQFWQSRKKEEINRSERKIGGADLPPVTQLFTEDYMVRFLLENSLGAWWAARHPDSPLIQEWEYLRWADQAADQTSEVSSDQISEVSETSEILRTPAAGAFPGWPQRAAEVTLMDPCCGSGHILVRGFHMLRKMRMEEEGLGAAEAAEAVLRDNLFGLEIDPRCTQIAAFALALEAWKVSDGARPNYRPLFVPSVACSGIPVQGQLENWLRLAGDDQALRYALERLHNLFKNAPDLGSLISPSDLPLDEQMFTAGYNRVLPLLEDALAKEQSDNDPTTTMFGKVAEGVTRALKFLSGKYTLVVTNVPYLTSRKQANILKEHCNKFFPDSKSDLSTVFLERINSFVWENGAYAVVTPQNWLFLGSYRKLREKYLRKQSWQIVANLGPSAFETIGGHVVKVALLVFANTIPTSDHHFIGFDVVRNNTPQGKALELQNGCHQILAQKAQFINPDARIILNPPSTTELLHNYADSYWGIGTGDIARFSRQFWEIPSLGKDWIYLRVTYSGTMPYAGMEQILYWQDGQGDLYKLAEELKHRLKNIWQRGNQAWGKKGVVISQMGELSASLYAGEVFQNGVAAIIPKKLEYLPAIWAFCSSPLYAQEVRKIDPKLSVTNLTLIKVPFDFLYWKQVAEKAGPPPEPYSNDPTQWLFQGQPSDSTEPLQTAVARLLGYRWPQQAEDGLSALADEDGLAPLSPLAHEAPAAERLRSLLAAAYGPDWSPAQQESLLAGVGFSGRSLEDWLRDGFFEQHCRLFHNRPFIWQIWDGRRDGFSILVNYPKLDGPRLEKLIYTYLGEWIHQQRARRDAGEPGAEGRLVAALELQKKLELIRQGEPPYDIYVRWKPLHQQPVGWEPDLNDGVRLNIRPFVTARVLRSRFTINWNKDRGKNPDGSERLNDLHVTNAEKRAAREAEEERLPKSGD